MGLLGAGAELSQIMASLMAEPCLPLKAGSLFQNEVRLRAQEELYLMLESLQSSRLGACSEIELQSVHVS